MSRNKIISLCEWAVIIATFGVDMWFSKYSGIPLNFSTNTILAIVLICALWPTVYVLTQWTGVGKGSEVIAESAAKFFAFVFAICCLEYYLASMGGPLWDDTLIKIDDLLGFSWPDFYAFVTRHSSLEGLLKVFYFSIMNQALAVMFGASIIFPERAARFTTAFIVSSSITMFFFWLFPVAGPFFAFHHTDLPLADYTLHYIKIREHGFATIPVDNLKGIVSFPSFHVSSAVILTYFFRKIPVIFPLVFILNIGMSIGALVIGGHYLCDLLAGAGVGGLTILFLRVLDRGHPETQISFKRKVSTSCEIKDQVASEVN